jgi:hypothetical protein
MNKAKRRINQIAQNKSGRIGFASRKAGGRFIQECLGKIRVARNAFYNGVFEIAGQRHAFPILWGC